MFLFSIIYVGLILRACLINIYIYIYILRAWLINALPISPTLYTVRSWVSSKSTDLCARHLLKKIHTSLCACMCMGTF